MHRSEIIRFRCCKSCPENRGSGKCGDLCAKLRLSTAASKQRPQGCSFLLQAAADTGAKPHPSIKQCQRSSSQISGTAETRGNPHFRQLWTCKQGVTPTELPALPSPRQQSVSPMYFLS